MLSRGGRGGGRYGRGRRRGGGWGARSGWNIRCGGVGWSVCRRGGMSGGWGWGVWGLAGLPRLSTVVHTAGVSHVAALLDTDPGVLGEVMAAKVAGALYLDEFLHDRVLDAFVLFGSIAGTWGAAAQGAYGAANAALD